jgi:2-hydroxychromene-2-carboxylate isomerase
MSRPIDFYFDFSSPFGYLASLQIDTLAERHGRLADWRPFLLGAVFKVAKTAPNALVPLKGSYSERDWERCARLLGVPLTLPPDFPFPSQAAGRAFYWLKAQDESAAKELARALLAASFVEGREVSKPETVLEVADAQGLERAAVEQALQDESVKQRLREETEGAIERGVCGSPFIFVDDEPFWGNDRLAMVDLWLERGGW